MPEKTVRAAVAYYRMSTGKQDKSIPDQRLAVAKLAAKGGYTIVREYVDEGISGDDTENRKGFLRMLQDAREKRDFGAVLCWDQDRFGRFDPLEAGYWIKPLRDAGVHLETVAQGLVNWEDFSGRIIYAVQQEGKHAFLRDLSRNTMRGMLSAAARGDWLGGPPPFGYRVVDRPGRPADLGRKRWPRTLEPDDPEKVRVVRWLFTTYAEKDVSIRWLAEELYRRGVPSPRGHARWAPMTIRELLTRREYLGDYDWGEEHHGGYHGIEKGETKARARKVMNKRGTRPKRLRMKPEDMVIVQQTHEPLIDRATWEKVQQKLADNRKRTTPEIGGGLWLLSGLLTCGACGSRMIGVTNVHHARQEGRWRRYRCSGYNQHGRGFCHCHTVDEAPLLRCLVRKLQEDFLNPDNLDQLRAELRRQSEQERRPDESRTRQLRAGVEELTRKIDTGTERLGVVPADIVPDLARRISEWKARRESMRQEMDELVNGPDLATADEEIRKAEEMLWQLREKIEGAEPAELRAVLREMVAKVELWWACGAKDSRKLSCRFARGLIHLRPDMRINRLVRRATPALL